MYAPCDTTVALALPSTLRGVDRAGPDTDTTGVRSLGRSEALRSRLFCLTRGGLDREKNHVICAVTSIKLCIKSLLTKTQILHETHGIY